MKIEVANSKWLLQMVGHQDPVVEYICLHLVVEERACVKDDV